MASMILLVSCAKKIEISSRDNAEISIDALEIHAAYDSESIDLDVTANAEWSISENPAWTTTEKLSDSQLRLTFTQNSGTSSREGSLTIIVTADETLSYTLKLIQYPAPPVADMIDVVFSEDGSATDVSQSGREVTYVSGTNCTISYNETYQRWAPTFSHSLGSSNTDSGYYRFDIDDDLETALADGYTLEAVFMIGTEPNGSETKAFSSTRYGGTALMVGSSSYNKELLFLTHNGSYVFVTTGVTPEVGTFYHMAGSWSQSEGMAYVYLDGEQLGSMSMTGNLQLGRLSPNYFTIGGNEQSQDKINFTWNGSVVVARIYNSVLTPEEISLSKLYIDMAGEKFRIVK